VTYRSAWILSLVIVTSGVVAPSAEAAKRNGTLVDEPLVGARLLHYPLKCHSGERCEIECYQGGRIVVSRTRLNPDDAASLVMTDGFSDRLQPLWLELRPASGGNLRTILLPRDALCDLQGLTVEPLGG